MRLRRDHMGHTLHRFAVHSSLALPVDPTCFSAAVDEMRDRLTVSLHSFAELPCQLALVQTKEVYDLGDSVLIWTNGFGMQVDFGVSYVRNYLRDVEAWPRVTKRMLNVGLSAATFLRGELPLHAGAVSLDGHFFGVLAASGTGKSTLIWSLVQGGALFGNDDLVTVGVGGGRPIAMPSVSLFPKLCAPSLEACGDGTPAVETYPDSGEFWMHIRSDQRLTEPQPLRCLFALEPDMGATGITARRWSEAEAHLLLPSHLHGAHFGRAFVGARALDTRLQTLAERVPIYSLRYPKRFDQIPALIETMREVAAD